MNVIGEAIGELCRIALPIPQESYRGRADSTVAVCTLSDITLLERLAVPNILRRVNIVGRLLSENKGIDTILRYLYANPHVRTVIVCGVDGAGHRAGHSLLCLYDCGMDDDETGRISNSRSPDPYLTATAEQVRHFCSDVRVVDMTGVHDYDILARCIDEHDIH